MRYFSPALTTFLLSAENPAATVFPYAAAGLPRHNVSWLGIFSRPSFGPWADSGFQLLFFSAHIQAAFLPPVYPEICGIPPLPADFPPLPTGFDLRQQHLNIRIASFLHGKPP